MSEAALKRYRAKRNFAITSEPVDGGEASAGALSFVSMLTAIPRVLTPLAFGLVAARFGTSFAFGLVAVGLLAALVLDEVPLALGRFTAEFEMGSGMDAPPEPPGRRMTEGIE
eukprot:gene42620-52863_t